MKSKFILKKPGQKLIKLDLEYKDNTIKSIQIKGDFFIYPEEAIEQLEKELVNEEINRDNLIKKIKEFFEKNNITPYGITAEAIVEAIEGCLNN
ncbi:hypothetical protein JXB41_05715 [Candidatus Woesearchaeota archaeon]|nr:hypothetical protein [Candidatus Woesearchaeota archaeon]